MSLTTPGVDEDVVAYSGKRGGGEGGRGGGEGGGRRGGRGEFSPFEEAEESVNVKIDPPVGRLHSRRPSREKKSINEKS